MKLQLIETAKTVGDNISIGTWYVKNGLEQYGHVVDVNTYPLPGYDCELIAAHHVTAYKDIVKFKKESPVRIIGGHALYSNHRPLIPFADIFCFGEWDSGFESLDSLRKSEFIRDRNFRTEKALPILKPYLNHDDTRSKAWYLEIARGCPFSCHYCELGNSQPYRKRGIDDIKNAIDMCDLTKTRKINLFAPDEASHPDYDSIIEYIYSKGAYLSGFGSMRIEKARKLKSLRDNMLIRVGVDGLTESRRFSVGKRISNDDIYEYFRIMTSAGHVNFKMFMIFGYENEKISDFNEFEKNMYRVFKLPLNKNISLRIKWTPLIPQPGTPLSDMKQQYDIEMVDRIKRWHLLNRKPKSSPGWYVENDGLMSKKSHNEQCELMIAGEDYFFKKGYV